MINVGIKNQSNDHLSIRIDRDCEIDNGYPTNHAIDQEKDLNNTQKFMSVCDNIVTENEVLNCVENNMTVRHNKYLTSDFDIKRDKYSIKSSEINPLESKQLEMNVQPWLNRTTRNSTDSLPYRDPDRRVRQRSSSTSSQSDFFQNLYRKYPQAFHNRGGQRPSRHLFNSGLRVHFEDDTSSLGDTGSVYSERPVTSYEKEIEEMLGSRFGVSRDCMTSPTPSMVSDSSTKQRLQATSESLKRILQHRKYERSKIALQLEEKYKRYSVASELSAYEMNHNPLSALEKELEYRERVLQSWNDRNKMDNTQKDKTSKSSHWRVHSPESMPDSAIDVDTSSVQSTGSSDMRRIPVHEKKPTEQDWSLYGSNSVGDENHPKKEKILVQKGVVHKDSDVDSGIVPSSNSDDVTVDPPSYKSAVSSRSETMPANHMKHPDKQGHRSWPSPVKADHSLMLNLQQSNPIEDEDSIAQEIITAQMSADLQRNRTYSHVHFEDEVDDTDPRLGIPSMTGEEKIIAERYRRRRSPMPFVISRTCVTAREDRKKSNSDNRQSRSHDRVSVLCTPRGQGETHGRRSQVLTNNGELRKSGSQQVLCSQKQESLRPLEKNSSCFSSQPNLSIEAEKSYRGKHKNSLTNGYPSTNLQQRNLPISSTVNGPCQLTIDQNKGAKHLQESKTLSKSQPNIAIISETLIKGRQPISRNSSSNSDHSSHTLVSSQLNLNGDDQNIDIANRTNHNIPFTSRNTRKKLHLKKYFKAKKGKYNPSLEENCFAGELGHGTSMPDLSGNKLEENVQYLLVSKHRSMQNLYQHSKDSDSDAEEVIKPASKVISNNTGFGSQSDSLSDRDSGVEAKNVKIHGGHSLKDSLSSDNSDKKFLVRNTSQQPKRSVSDSSSQSGFSSGMEDIKTRSQLTPYESSVMHLDKQGLNVNQLIESDSDSFSAKCVVIDKARLKKNNVNSESRANRDLEELNKIQSQERRYRKKGDQNPAATKPLPIISYDQKHNRDIDVVNRTHRNLLGACQDQQDDVARNSVSSSASSMSSQGQTSLSSDQNRKVQTTSEKQETSDSKNIVEEKPPISHAVQQIVDEPIKTSKESSVHVYAEVNFKSKKISEDEQKKLSNKLSLSKPNEGKQLSNSNKSSVSTPNEGRQLSNKLSGSTPNILANYEQCVDIDIEEENPPLPDRDYYRETNLVKTKELSASKQSLSDKMGSFKKAAKSKFKAIRKAVSMDKGIDEIGVEGQPKVKDKKKKEKKGFFGLFSKKKSKKKEQNVDAGDNGENLEDIAASGLQQKWNSCNSIETAHEEQHMKSRLCNINKDGTQVVEINKPHNKAIDFFISRGNAQFKHGVFVSRFIDNQKSKYSGLLCVGDEIIEVNGFKVQDMLLDDVYGLLSNTEKLVITILPLLARRDV